MDIFLFVLNMLLMGFMLPSVLGVLATVDDDGTSIDGEDVASLIFFGMFISSFILWLVLHYEWMTLSTITGINAILYLIIAWIGKRLYDATRVVAKGK